VGAHDPDLDNAEEAEDHCDPDQQRDQTHREHGGGADQEGRCRDEKEVHQLNRPKMTVD
jgi:hypothetical protein